MAVPYNQTSGRFRDEIARLIGVDLPDGRRVRNGAIISAGDATSADATRTRDAALDTQARSQAIGGVTSQAGTISTFDNRAVGFLNQANAEGRIPQAKMPQVRGGTLGLAATGVVGAKGEGQGAMGLEGGWGGSSLRSPASSSTGSPSDTALFQAKQRLIGARSLGLGRNYSDEALTNAKPEDILAEAGLLDWRLQQKEQAAQQAAFATAPAMGGGLKPVGGAALGFTAGGPNVSTAATGRPDGSIFVGDVDRTREFSPASGSVQVGGVDRTQPFAPTVAGSEQRVASMPNAEVAQSPFALSAPGAFENFQVSGTGGAALGVSAPVDDGLTPQEREAVGLGNRVEAHVSGAVNTYLIRGGNPAGVQGIAVAARAQIDPTNELSDRRRAALQSSQQRAMEQRQQQAIEAARAQQEITADAALGRQNAAEEFKAGLAEKADHRKEIKDVTSQLKTVETAAAKLGLYNPALEEGTVTQNALKAMAYEGRWFTGGDSLGDIPDQATALGVFDARGDAEGKKRFVQEFNKAREDLVQTKLGTNPEAAQILATREELRAKARELGIAGYGGKPEAGGQKAEAGAEKPAAGAAAKLYTVGEGKVAFGQTADPLASVQQALDDGVISPEGARQYLTSIGFKPKSK